MKMHHDELRLSRSGRDWISYGLRCLISPFTYHLGVDNVAKGILSGLTRIKAVSIRSQYTFLFDSRCDCDDIYDLLFCVITDQAAAKDECYCIRRSSFPSLMKLLNHHLGMFRLGVVVGSYELQWPARWPVVKLVKPQARPHWPHWQVGCRGHAKVTA